MADLEQRITNIESNYTRMGDSLRRTAEANEKTQSVVQTLSNTLIGYIDKKTSKFFKGYITIFEERIGDIEEKQNECLGRQEEAKKSKKGRIMQIAKIFKEVAVFLICGYLAFKFGLK